MNKKTFDLELCDLEPLMTPKTKIVTFTHCSNVLGWIVDAKKITEFVHARGAKSCIDGVAFAPHNAVDV